MKIVRSVTVIMQANEVKVDDPLAAELLVRPNVETVTISYKDGAIISYTRMEDVSDD